MDDGLILRSDVYRPKTGALVPVIMTLGPCGRGVMYQDGAARGQAELDCALTGPQRKGSDSVKPPR